MLYPVLYDFFMEVCVCSLCIMCVHVFMHILVFFVEVLPERQSMVFVGYAFALAFGITTSVANPILYTSLNESFRHTLKASVAIVEWCLELPPNQGLGLVGIELLVNFAPDRLESLKTPFLPAATARWSINAVSSPSSPISDQ